MPAEQEKVGIKLRCYKLLDTNSKVKKGWNSWLSINPMGRIIRQSQPMERIAVFWGREEGLLAVNLWPPVNFHRESTSSKCCPKWIQICCQVSVTDPLWVSSLAKWTRSQLSHNINATSSEGLELPLPPSLTLSFAKVSWHSREAAGQGKPYSQEQPLWERPSCYMPNLPHCEITHFQTHMLPQLLSPSPAAESKFQCSYRKQVVYLFTCSDFSNYTKICHCTWHFFPTMN